MFMNAIASASAFWLYAFSMNSSKSLIYFSSDLRSDFFALPTSNFEVVRSQTTFFSGIRHFFSTGLNYSSSLQEKSSTVTLFWIEIILALSFFSALFLSRPILYSIFSVLTLSTVRTLLALALCNVPPANSPGAFVALETLFSCCPSSLPRSITWFLICSGLRGSWCGTGYV